MPMYNLIERNDAYSKTSGSSWQYYRDEPALDNKGNITGFPANNKNSNSFRTPWRTLEMPLVNCEISR